ncbi:MAG TPA: nucleotidyltransferase, partial [Planctomycetes bacterium]|nr:nucleotidyltransferase [Planctomycetota bacterium]
MHDLENLLERLIEGGVEFTLIGGFAAVAHGATFLTRDLDVA